MGQWLHFPAADGFVVPAYLARPAGPPHAAVVVLQEIFGLNSHIRSVADRYAAHGYLALAPALFARIRPAVELAYTEADIQTGSELKAAVAALPGAGVQQDIQAAIDYAAKNCGGNGVDNSAGKVGIVGFCWGGLLTWRAACLSKGLSAAVVYYGGGITADEEIKRQPQCPVMAHFGDSDALIPLPGVAAFGKAHPAVALHIYAAGHGFYCDQRGSYNETAAQLAQQRTLEFFAAKLS